jgi:hypothetical protein
MQLSEHINLYIELLKSSSIDHSRELISKLSREELLEFKKFIEELLIKSVDRISIDE